jgi:transcriptional regulator with XRE-family HTH domain
MDRNHLADFLRGKRHRLRPEDVGLGLKRDEVARLANISVEYYARLEQARGSNPSGRVLIGLAHALRLTSDERSHLFSLAGVAAESPRGACTDVPSNRHGATSSSATSSTPTRTPATTGWPTPRSSARSPSAGYMPRPAAIPTTHASAP